jgi:DNA-binding NarL/FixJ family response regulator
VEPEPISAFPLYVFASMATRIYIVDDHPLVPQGLSQIIAKEEDMEICGEAEDSPGAMKGVGDCNPDAIIVDISLRGNNGLELIKNLKAIHEEIPILVFSMHDESIYAQRALRAGAKAYVMKKERSERSSKERFTSVPRSPTKYSIR